MNEEIKEMETMEKMELKVLDIKTSLEHTCMVLSFQKILILQIT